MIFFFFPFSVSTGRRLPLPAPTRAVFCFKVQMQTSFCTESPNAGESRPQGPWHRAGWRTWDVMNSLGWPALASALFPLHVTNPKSYLPRFHPKRIGDSSSKHSLRTTTKALGNIQESCKRNNIVYSVRKCTVNIFPRWVSHSLSVRKNGDTTWEFLADLSTQDCSFRLACLSKAASAGLVLQDQGEPLSSRGGPLALSGTWNPFSSGCREASRGVLFRSPRSAGQARSVLVGIPPGRLPSGLLPGCLGGQWGLGSAWALEPPTSRKALLGSAAAPWLLPGSLCPARSVKGSDRTQRWRILPWSEWEDERTRWEMRPREGVYSQVLVRIVCMGGCPMIIVLSVVFSWRRPSLRSSGIGCSKLSVFPKLWNWYRFPARKAAHPRN